MRLSSIAALTIATAGAAQAADFPAARDPQTLTAWLPANTALKPEDVVSVGGGRAVVIAARRPDPETPGLLRVTVHAEIVDPEAAAKSHALSESQELLVDCQGRKAKAEPMLQFEERNLSGRSRKALGWDVWVVGQAGTVLERVIAASCDPQFKGVLAMQAGPAAPQDQALYDVVRGRGGPATPPHEVTMAPPAAPAPAPAPRPAKPAAGPKPAVTPARTGKVSIQIAAAPSPSSARTALQAFARKHPQYAAGRPTRVEAVTVDGKTYHRALVAGFADLAEAMRACDRLKAAGQECIVRR